MSTIKRMPFDPDNPYKPDEAGLEEMRNFVNTDFSDCPKLTEEQLKLTRRAMDAHPEWYTPRKR